MIRSCLPLALFLSFAPCLAAASEVAQDVVINADSTARLLPIASDGWAGSSANVIAGIQNSLFTDGPRQFAVFYASDGTLVLSKRTLGEDVWTSLRSPYRGRVADAHNVAAVIVDGAGFLHVAWDHHDNPLNYARSLAPHSLKLGARQAMTGLHEGNVTYPSFLRLPDGDILFLYRDGSSGKGNLVLNRYCVRDGTWSQVHEKLIDGQGRLSAYCSTFVDVRGTLHMAWVWRSSPDVATNHDLCYARSTDGGATWTSVSGKPLSIPITADNADYALRIAPGRSLMNPPSLTADGKGNPFIADYWCPEGSSVPQYHLVHYDGAQWHVSQVTQRKTPFALSGSATKHPPLSRSALFTRQGSKQSREVFLVYRDDDRGGRIVVAMCPDLSKPAWHFSELTQEGVGAWEPSMDAVQWSRLSQLHLLVQKVDQKDGNDSRPADSVSSPISSLIWSPTIADFAPEQAAPKMPAAGSWRKPLSQAAVLSLMERVADWQLRQPLKYGPAGWENSPFYIGVLALSRISKSPAYEAAILTQAEKNGWKPAPRLYHADDYCVVQAYLELYRRNPEPKRLAPSRERFDAILARPANTSLDMGLPGTSDRWSWCDALFMGPASWLMVYQATGDSRYLDFMNREWWATTEALYVPSERLYARDQSFLDLREPNDRRLFWARGNGWVVAGLARVLDLLPKDYPETPRYLALYREMMESTLASQQPDGLWRPGLLDPALHNAKETSGSSFYTFAMAWGINRGHLDRRRFEPAVRRAWTALADCVNAEGKLGHVQPIGAAPAGFNPENSEPFGVGAFLLAGSEVYQLVASPDQELP
jgi:rhamnogalacturonyl hydrolase YesR